MLYYLCKSWLSSVNLSAPHIKPKFFPQIIAVRMSSPSMTTHTICHIRSPAPQSKITARTWIALFNLAKLHLWFPVFIKIIKHPVFFNLVIRDYHSKCHWTYDGDLCYQVGAWGEHCIYSDLLGSATLENSMATRMCGSDNGPLVVSWKVALVVWCMVKALAAWCDKGQTAFVTW